MNAFREPILTVQRAVWGRRFPDDVACTLEESLRAFQPDPSAFDAPGLCGPAKQAELTVKLGYWLVLGHLTAAAFRETVARIPVGDNGGWDVDLRPRQPRSALPRILKMECLAPPPEAGFARQA